MLKLNHQQLSISKRIFQFNESNKHSTFFKPRFPFAIIKKPSLRPKKATQRYQTKQINSEKSRNSKSILQNSPNKSKKSTISVSESKRWKNRKKEMLSDRRDGEIESDKCDAGIRGGGKLMERRFKQNSRCPRKG